MSITLEEFNTKFKVQIKNIAIPHVDSTGSQLASIGFNVICIANSRVQYFEYHINDQNIVSTYTPSELIDYAWSNLQSSVNTWALTALTLPSLIGYVIPHHQILLLPFQILILHHIIKITLRKFKDLKLFHPMTLVLGVSDSELKII